ncbi:DUF1345 domain-containing protein [Variovorax sp. OV329]|uniref:DUF1345 domain-containing protein n=1 Tax=Variovorax sp. OV329 TaxID=1882825 RepID=UPI0008ED8B2B|nr:DUF1345 domain-containing protein [Variovorax sp. OV329]SFM10942.1 Uncharacterized membrane protein [Variovorax sp. OV329]
MQMKLSTTTGPERLAYGLALGTAVGLVHWPLLNGMARGVLAWTAGAGLYLALAFWLAHTFDAQQTRARAQALDQPNVVLLIVMLTAVVFSVVAIAMLLQQVKELAGMDRVLHVGLALVALTVSWLMIHTVYAFHYAHHYYIMEKSGETDEPALDFPGKAEPDYSDFIYYAYVVGMTSQVSDVQVQSSDLRRITLVHSVLSFAFNMLVLALSINVVAGVIA